MSLRDSSKNVCRSVILAGTGGSKAAFFCLLFFAAAKKSRCRPAQGRRVKYGYEIADASKGNSKRKKQKQQNQTRACRSRNCKIIGVKINCIASPIFPPGTTITLGRDIKESCSMVSR